MADAVDWPQAYGPDWGVPDPTKVDLTAELTDSMIRDITCLINAPEGPSQDLLGVRISALFVILVVSSAVTFFPVIATRSKRVKIPLYFYLFARYFGAGVIVATAFVQ